MTQSGCAVIPAVVQPNPKTKLVFHEGHPERRQNQIQSEGWRGGCHSPDVDGLIMTTPEIKDIHKYHDLCIHQCSYPRGTRH